MQRRRFLLGLSGLAAASAAGLALPRPGHAQGGSGTAGGGTAGGGAAGGASALTPDTVAARVQAFYDRTTRLRVDFAQHYWSSVYRRTTSSRGRLSILRPGRIRFDYTAPSGKVVVSDGRTFTYYEPGDEGGSGQFWRGSADGASSALGFLTGSARLARDYTFSLRAHADTDPPETDALLLRPRTADPHFDSIVLYVGNTDAILGVVRRVSIRDHEDNWNRFDFSHFAFDPGDVTEATFAYSPPDGAREIAAPAAR